MNANYYHEFLVLTKSKNYLEAADSLYIGQSTLTRHIQTMESELGVQLFDRSNRHVTLTPYGKLLIPYAEKIADSIEAYTKEIQEMRLSNIQQIRVGVVPSMVSYKVTNIMAEFNQANPDILINLIEGDTLDLRRELLNKNCNLAFLRETYNNVLSDDLFVKIPYSKDKIMLVTSKKHPLARRKSVSLKLITKENYLSMHETTVLYSIYKGLFKKYGINPDIKMQFKRMDSLFDMVEHGVGVTLAMDKHLGQEQRNRNLAMTPLAPEENSVLYLCYRKDHKLSKAEKEFIEYTKRHSSYNENEEYSE